MCHTSINEQFDTGIFKEKHIYPNIVTYNKDPAIIPPTPVAKHHKLHFYL